ncbi:MAG: alpha/beta hydrolase, partial [Stenotrophomonas sp.]|nr:alpha/beta hydrolase [Stenotrophomonas sp.]
IPNSVDNLDENDPFVRAAADFPISAQVNYHSIVAQANAEVALADSDDGLVPYRSAHLPGAQSEKIIISGHSVQQSAAAVLEIQRILREDIALREAHFMQP